MQIKENDKEAWEAAGLLNYDFCELCCKLQIEMAKTNKEYDEEEYFSEAWLMESTFLI